MKRTTIFCLTLLLAAAGAWSASAQQSAMRRNVSGGQQQQPETTAGGEAVGAFSTPAEIKKSQLPDGLFRKQTIVTREPIPYPRVREADVIWQKRLWRVIPLHEKMNLPLYYPTVEMTSRRSLTQTLVDAIRSGEIRAFDPDEDDEFTTIISPQDLSARFDATDRTERRQKMDGSGDTTIVVRGSYNWDEVQEVLIKEDWFFDKHYSTLRVRIVGICPIRVYKKALNTAGSSSSNEEEDDDGDLQKKQLFWVHYDEARSVLARTPAQMPENDATPKSFDDLFNNRRFSSYITKESNPHNNRPIRDYTPNGYAAMLESERIKNSIFTFEHDLWEY